MKSILSKPGKMPGYGFGIEAGATCPSAKQTVKEHGDKAICSGCYAKTGFYKMANVKNAHAGRLAFILHSLKNDNGEAFIEAMVSEIQKRVNPQDPVFRIHDSGDFFNPGYIRCWTEIVRRLPHIQFWAPTREWLRDSQVPHLRDLAALPNITVRPSAARMDTPSPVVEGLHAGSAVYTNSEDVPGDHNICPATRKGAERTCDAHNCRSCWTQKDTPVAYILH